MFHRLKAVADAGSAPEIGQPRGAALYFDEKGLTAIAMPCAAAVGADHPVLQQQRVATISNPGSWAWKVGADFLKRYFQESASGSAILPGKTTVTILAGLDQSKYPWYNKTTNGVRFNDLWATLKTLPTAVLCCCIHVRDTQQSTKVVNDQSDPLIEILKARELLPFLDIAYQGFGAYEEDAYAIRAIASAGFLPLW
ncbi:aminotransferase class I/II-fold pyridoxal phosphate-dependent enzyme [Shigella flexneri]